MQNLSDIARPASQNVTKVIKPVSPSSGRFGFGVFGKARFGSNEGYNPIARNALSENQISFDATATNGNTLVSANNISWVHLCSGSNRILFVFVLAQVFPNSSMTVQCGATTMISINGGADADGQTFTVFGFYLVNPPLGSNTINVTLPVGVSASMWGASISYNGASQSGQLDSQTLGNDGGNDMTFSVSTTVVAPGSWIIFGIENNDNHQPTLVPSNYTIRQWNNQAELSVGDSNGIVNPGANTITATAFDLEQWAVVLASFAPVHSSYTDISRPS